MFEAFEFPLYTEHRIAPNKICMVLRNGCGIGSDDLWKAGIGVQQIYPWKATRQLLFAQKRSFQMDIQNGGARGKFWADATGECLHKLIA